MEQYFIKKAERIKPGAKYTMYMTYCTACNVFKRIIASPPAGPGGTLSCPICQARRENGPGIERSFGCVKVKTFQIILPEEVNNKLSEETK